MSILETERLTLDRLSFDDAPFIFELVNEPSFLRHIGDKGVRNLDDARAYLRDGPLASYEHHGFGLLKVSLTDGTPIGINGLLKRDELPDADIGFAFLPAYWGHGYAYESAVAVLEWGQRDLGIERVVAIVSPGNASSERLLEKIGLSFEKMMHLPGESEDVQLFTPSA